MPPSETFAMFVTTSVWLVVTAPRVTDSAANGAFVFASIKASNSAAVILIAVIPLSAISRPLAKTAASLVVTAPIVTEFALKASSARNPVTAASASDKLIESI